MRHDRSIMNIFIIAINDIIQCSIFIDFVDNFGDELLEWLRILLMLEVAY